MNELNHKSKIRGHWFKVDNLLIDTYARELGIVPLAIYIVLKRHANKDNVAWPSIELIAEELGTSTRNITRYAKKLEEWGLIYRRKGRKYGMWGNYTYFLKDRNQWFTPNDFVGPSRDERHGHTEVPNSSLPRDKLSLD